MNTLDQVISFFSPKTGLERAKVRAQEKLIRESKRSYDGATRGRRADGWTSAGSNNQNIDIQRSLTALRERMIDGYKNNSTIFRAIRTIQNGVVGTGIMPTPVAISCEKKLTDNELKKIKSAWEWFVKNCDYDGFFSFYGLQGLGMRTTAMQGEIFVVRQRDVTGTVPFKLQIMAPYMVDHNKSGYLLSARQDHYVVQGVEFDARGRRVGYWMHEYNPNNEFVIKLAPKFVPIDDVLQVFYKEFPEQVRALHNYNFPYIRSFP